MTYQLYALPIAGFGIMTLGIDPSRSFAASTDNPDYQQFKKDLSAGVELLDAEGNQMTREQVAEFLKTLP